MVQVILEVVSEVCNKLHPLTMRCRAMELIVEGTPFPFSLCVFLIHASNPLIWDSGEFILRLRVRLVDSVTDLHLDGSVLETIGLSSDLPVRNVKEQGREILGLN